MEWGSGVEGVVMLYGFLYRLTMTIAHYYNWHYAPPIHPDGDKQLWCKWCGFRQTVKYAIEDFRVYKNVLLVNEIENIYKVDVKELESTDVSKIEKSVCILNTHDNVRIRLNEYGKEILLKQFEERHIIAPHVFKEFTLPEEDSDGYSTWLLWDLTHRFGEYMIPGAKKPFD